MLHIKIELTKMNSQLNSLEIAAIHAALKQNTQRTFVHNLGLKKVFIKCARKTRLPFGALAIRYFLKIFGVDYLGVGVRYGGLYSFDCEITALKTFRDMGMHVPKILYQENNLLVLELLQGDNVDNLMRDKNLVLDLWHESLMTISKMHQMKLCHSQCFARNLVWANNKVHLIDLEENPLDSMTLPQAQARDFIYFLLSTLWRFESYTSQLQIWKEMMEDIDSSVPQILNRIARKFAWLRYFPQNRKIWGRDIVQLHAIGKFFFALKSLE
jgi:tRNA A-37 threonylcarbamoyl transferase component Bud32